MELALGAMDGRRERIPVSAQAWDRALGVGVETVGTDAGQAGTFDPPFPNHTLMHGAGKFGLASLRNLDQLPPVGAVAIAAPLKIFSARQK
jgi:kynurenine formamidase